MSTEALLRDDDLPADDVVTPSTDMSLELGRYQGTDYYFMSDMLSAEERAIRQRVSTFVDEQLLPQANYYWERAEFPYELVSRWAELGYVGGTIQGYGCPGLTPLAEGVISMQLARGDGSFALINSVHSGLNMHVIDMFRFRRAKAALAARHGPVRHTERVRADRAGPRLRCGPHGHRRSSRR